MKQRILAFLLALVLALGCLGCTEGEPPVVTGPQGENSPWHVSLDQPEPEAPAQPVQVEQPENKPEEPLTGGHWLASGRVDSGGEAPESQFAQTVQAAIALSSQGLTLAVDNSTGEMVIDRPEQPVEQPMGEAGTWTIFVYLCGTDLESGGGMASADLREMMQGATGDKVRFVVQTGGAYSWYYRRIDSNKNQRYVVENGELTLVDEVSRSGMGRSSTLADFLQWGVSSYPAEHMGVILWDHGGGSISGVCFDELDWYDSLSLRELDTALLSVYDIMTTRFDFFGFDACLMGTIECANILATYARYMYGSEETEPGSGWDYREIGRFLTADPEADGLALGQVVCDSFYESCRRSSCEDLATMSVVDLSKLDELIVSFNTFAEHMYDASSDAAALSAMIRGIENADNFGGNNRVEGYTNMVDLGGILKACANYAQGAQEAMAALEDAVVYCVNGDTHRTASGLATYYPLSIQGSEELSVFGDICVSPYYLSFVDRQNYGGVNQGDTSDYSSDYWYDDDNLWFWVSDYDFDAGSGQYSYEQSADEYWDYVEDFEQTGESPLITFATPPTLDPEDGTYWFVLDDSGIDNAASVCGYVFELSYDGEDVIELGETWDVYGDWETGYFSDGFDGYWLSLPDGQNLACYIAELAEDHVVYTSPIMLNGEVTFLRLRQNLDGTVLIEGAWNGIDDTGAADRDYVQLQARDVLVPLYYSYAVDDFSEWYYEGVEYRVTEDMEISYEWMEAGDYLFAFWIDDIYGDYYLTDFEVFNVDADGGLYFYE